MLKIKFKVEYKRRYFINFGGKGEANDKLSAAYSRPIYFELIGDQTTCQIHEVDNINNSQEGNQNLNIVGGFTDNKVTLIFKIIP